MRGRAYALDNRKGKEEMLGQELSRTLHRAPSNQKSAAEVEKLFMDAAAEEAKKRKSRLPKIEKRKKRTEQELDPQNWTKTPWRSAHDGMNTCSSLAFKWNDQVPQEETRAYQMYDSTLRRNKKHVTPKSDYGGNFVHHAVYKPQTPQVSHACHCTLSRS